MNKIVVFFLTVTTVSNGLLAMEETKHPNTAQAYQNTDKRHERFMVIFNEMARNFGTPTEQKRTEVIDDLQREFESDEEEKVPFSLPTIREFKVMLAQQERESENS